MISKEETAVDKLKVFGKAEGLYADINDSREDIVLGKKEPSEIKLIIHKINDLGSLSMSGALILDLNGSMLEYINKEDNVDRNISNSYREIVLDNLQKMYIDLYSHFEIAGPFAAFARFYKDYDPACYGISHQLITIGRENDNKIDYLVGKMSKCELRGKIIREHYLAVKKAAERDEFKKNKLVELQYSYSQMSQSFKQELADGKL